MRITLFTSAALTAILSIRIRVVPAATAVHNPLAGPRFGRCDDEQPIPDPYASLPWNTEHLEVRNARRLAVKNASLFQELGLPEDATYEDVAAKTKCLIELTNELLKIEGVKKKIKMEIARDKIYQICLNERIAGVRTEQKDASRVFKLEEEGINGL